MTAWAYVKDSLTLFLADVADGFMTAAALCALFAALAVLG